MRSAVVVELDPVGNDAHGVALVLEAVLMHALLLHRPDQALHHPVLLRAVWGDELLSQPVAANQARVDAAGEHQSVVRPTPPANQLQSEVEFSRSLFRGGSP